MYLPTQTTSMVEVFKTNITDKVQANKLLNHIHHRFDNYIANFDLHDCDNILRVKSTEGAVQTAMLISFLHSLGCYAEVLTDECPPAGKFRIMREWYFIP